MNAPSLQESQELALQHQQNLLHYDCTIDLFGAFYDSELAEQQAGRPSLLDPSNSEAAKCLGEFHLSGKGMQHDTRYTMYSSQHFALNPAVSSKQQTVLNISSH